MVFVSAAFDIAAIAVVLAIISQIMQRKLMNKKANKENKKMIKEKQQKMKELMKKTDDKSKKELEKLQHEYMELTKDMLQGSMKYMLFSFPMFIIALYGIKMLYEGVIIPLPFPLPIFGKDVGWFGYYIIVAILSSIIISIIFKTIEKVIQKGK